MSSAFRHDDACDCDVLVVGGGLVGLAASMFLAQQGLRVWVVERHPSTSSHPKLRGVSARTMELYRSAGIEEAVRAAGENHFGVAIGDSLSGEYERVHLPLALARQNRLSPTTHYACDQDRMEPILLQRSAELGAQPFYGAQRSTSSSTSPPSPQTWCGLHPLSARPRQQSHRVGSPPDTWLPRTVPGARSVPTWA